MPHFVAAPLRLLLLLLLPQWAAKLLLPLLRAALAVQLQGLTLAAPLLLLLLQIV